MGAGAGRTGWMVGWSFPVVDVGGWKEYAGGILVWVEKGCEGDVGVHW